MKTPIKVVVSEPGSGDARIVDAAREDIGRVHGDKIVYPKEAALEIVRAINQRDRLLKSLDEAQAELDLLKSLPTKLDPIDLSAISRYPNLVFTQVTFDGDSRLNDMCQDANGKPAPWLEFGECDIRNESSTSCISGRMRSGITDFEHDSCYVVRIDLVGLKYSFTDGQISWFEAVITPEIEDIRIHDPSFVPEKVKGAYECDVESCEKHLILPEGYYTPPIYKYAKAVAGKRIRILTGPKWSKLLKFDKR